MLTRRGSCLLVACALSAAMIAGCGGNKLPPDNDAPTDNTPSAPPAPVAAVIISGVAATGTAFAPSTVDIVDRTGTSIGSAISAPNGSFSIEARPGFIPPLVLTATRLNPLGGEDILVSTVDTRTSATVNINPVSTLVAALMSATGHPSTLAAELASGQVTFDEKVIIANWNKVESVLKPVLSALKTDINDLKSGPAPANGTGPDLLLDALDVSITRNENKTSTIEITVKTEGDGQEMPVIRFANSMLLEQVLKANRITPTEIQNRAINAASLPAPGTSTQIDDLLKRMTACFALPTAARVDNQAGRAMNVIAPQCRSLFLNDDPTTYLHSAETVGADGAFAGLFSDSGTGAGFGQGTFEYRRDNGHIVFSYVSVSNKLTARHEESVAVLGRDGNLRLIGNQYRFAGSVNPMAEQRSYVDHKSEFYISTGYDIKVPLQDFNGQMITRVNVTSPLEEKYSLVRGTSAMTLPKLDRNFVPELNDDGTITSSSSSFIRFNAISYVDYFFSFPRPDDNAPYTGEPDFQLQQPKAKSSAAIAAYPPRGTWTLEYFTAGSATPVARQSVRTRARAMTMEELDANDLVSLGTIWQLTDASLKPLLARLDRSRPGSGFFLPLQGLTSTSHEWSPIPIPRLTPLRPVAIRMRGTMLQPAAIPPISNFVDSVDLTPDMRSATVPCGSGTGVPHCDAQGAYLPDTWLENIQLLARDAHGRELSSITSFWLRD